MKSREEKFKFLVDNIYKDLVNDLDKDTPTILYFNEKDFAKILQRVKELGIGIFGIEVALKGLYNGVELVEDYNTTPTDFLWYTAAFEKLRKQNSDFRYSASYQVQL